MHAIRPWRVLERVRRWVSRANSTAQCVLLVCLFASPFTLMDFAACVGAETSGLAHERLVWMRICIVKESYTELVACIYSHLQMRKLASLSSFVKFCFITEHSWLRVFALCYCHWPLRCTQRMLCTWPALLINSNIRGRWSPSITNNTKFNFNTLGGSGYRKRESSWSQIYTLNIYTVYIHIYEAVA